MIKFLGDFDYTMIYIALAFDAIALIVFLLRKFVPGLSGEDKKQTEEEIAEENVSNKLSSLEEEEKIKKAIEEDEEE